MEGTSLESTAEYNNIGGVFVSYSSGDLERVIPFVSLLVARGVRVWIDYEGMHASNQIPEQLSNAISRAKVVAFFASSNAFASRYVRQELQLAFEKKVRILPLNLDDTAPPEGLDLILAGIHAIHLYRETLSSSLEQLYRSLREHNVTVPDALAESEKTHSFGPRTAYLVDRKPQRQDLRDALRSHKKKLSCDPLVLIAYGPEEQLLREYCINVETDHMPSALVKAGYVGILKWFELDWTTANPRGNHEEIEDELGIEEGSLRSHIGYITSRSESALVLCHHIDCSSWTGSDFKKLSDYITSWAGVPGITSDYPLILLISCTHYKQEKKRLDWLRRFPFQRLSLAEQFKAIGTREEIELHAKLCTELGDVFLTDINSWITKDLKSMNCDRLFMLSNVRTVFSDSGFLNGDGLPMRSLVEPLQKLLKMSAKEHHTNG